METEYQIRIRYDGKEVVRKGFAYSVQLLLNRFKDNCRIRPVGESIPFQFCSYFGFYPEKIRKNLAISTRRLQETFSAPNMFADNETSDG